MCYEGLSLLHSRLCTLCIYVECYTENVIFRICRHGGNNEMQEETCGNMRAESQALKSERRSFKEFFIVLCTYYLI